MAVPTTAAGWEAAYHLPAGVLDAIDQNPTHARIAEIIAKVRDDALKKHGIPAVGTWTGPIPSGRGFSGDGPPTDTHYPGKDEPRSGM